MASDGPPDISTAQAARWLTDARFAPYLAEADDNHDLALELYVWNARISSALFETLHHVEVLLRNAIDAQFVPADAGAAPRDTWLEDTAILTLESLQRIAETIRRIRRDGRRLTRGHVVAGLSFGFWRALFDKRYDRLWVSHLHRAFPHGSGDRAQIATTMSALVPFHNRIAHHETIILRPIQVHYNELLTLASWIDPAAAEWIVGAARVETVLSARPGSA